MKQFKIIATFFFILITVVIIGLVIFLKTLDLNRFKGQITQQMSKSINRDVQIKDVSIKFSIGKGVVLNISGLKILGHAQFSSEPIFYIDSCHLSVELLPFLKKRQVLVSKVIFDSPKIMIIRNNQGDFNTGQVEKSKKVKKVDEKNIQGGGIEKLDKENKEDKSGNIVFGEILIRSIFISDGTFIFVDQSIDPTATIEIKNIDMRVSNVSFDKQFPFVITASLWSKKDNIQINGLAQMNAINRQTRIDDLIIQSDLTDLSVGRINEAVPSFKSINQETEISGQLNIMIPQMILGEDGLLVLSSEGRLTGGKILLKDAPVPIENLNIHFKLSESDAEINEIKMSLASGTIVGNGQIFEYLGEQKFVANLSMSDVQIDELTTKLEFPVKMEGVIHGNINGKGKGFNAQALQSALRGSGKIEVKEGKIIDVNLLSLVLSKISFAPNLVSNLENDLPDRYKEKLNQKDTILEKVQIDVQILNGNLMISQAELIADGFLATAQGKIDFDQNMNLKADFYIPSDLSETLIAQSQELKFLLNERNEVHIPFKPYSGKLSKFRMYPDIEDVGKEILKNRGREELKKVIFKALDIEGGETEQLPQQESEQQDGSNQEPQTNPEEEMIENILDMIPIFQ